MKVKVINRNVLSYSDEANVISEVTILRLLDNTHIIKCYDFIPESSQYFIVLEYLEGGELFDRIVQKSHYTGNE